MNVRICAFVLAAIVFTSLAIVPSGVGASGTEAGTQPDRVFTITKSKNDNSYTTEVTPSFNGEWWVELSSISKGKVTVTLCEGLIIGEPRIMSSHLSDPGELSERAYVRAGNLYVLSFKLQGESGTAVLREHFMLDLSVPELPPFETTPHAPIAIDSSADLLDPANGVTRGTGTAQDPYIIEGWEISGSNVTGIKICFVGEHVVVRNCFVHAIGYPWPGIYLFMTSNIVVDNCYVEQCVGSEIAILVDSSHDILISNNTIWSYLYIYDSEFCEFVGNSIHEALVTVYYSTNLLFRKNTLSDSPWMAMWFVGTNETLVVHNNFVDNVDPDITLTDSNSITWDVGLPYGGNYWSDYTGQDLNSDGIGDTPFVIDPSNQDNCPLMNPV